MTPRQAAPKPNPWAKYLPYILSALSFVAGYGINAITISAQVNELTVTVNEMRKERDVRHDAAMEFRSKTNSRLSAIEVKVFGHADVSYTAFVFNKR
jgi:hypothetical protein